MSKIHEVTTPRWVFQWNWKDREYTCRKDNHFLDDEESFFRRMIKGKPQIRDLDFIVRIRDVQ